MLQLNVRMFGGLEVRRGGRLLPPFPTQKSRSLFAYLVLHRERPVHRDMLCGALWGDCSDHAARKALRTALWRIRSVIELEEEDRGAFLEVESHQVGFRSSDRVWVDTWEFEDCVRAVAGIGGGELERGEVERLEAALVLYRGDLLEGHYDDCFIDAQDRLRLNHLTMLERLLEHHRQGGKWLEAIAVGRRLLRCDPLREHIHRAVMECHLAMGDRPSALRQYADCVRSLDEALDIEPMEETRRLHARIRSSGASAPGSLDGGPAGQGTDLGRLAAEMHGALRTLHDVTERLEQARIVMASRRSVPSGSSEAPALRISSSTGGPPP